MLDVTDSVKWSGLTLPNRIVMAPMTRVRSVNQRADDLTAEYYAQRASAGLIISEGTFTSPTARGFAAVPGIWSDRQVAGWRQVTNEVHDNGGRIVAQLWHAGRVSHTALQPDSACPIGPTDEVAVDGRAYIFGSDGDRRFVRPSTPRAMTEEDILAVVEEFGVAAANAMAAGFDGVEIHGADGFLINQFLNKGVNTREDAWGGTLENRLRFPLAVVDAVVTAVTRAGHGPGRVGFQVSPYGSLNGMPLYTEIEATYLVLASELSRRRVGYAHLSDQASSGDSPRMGIPEGFLKTFREEFTGLVILTGGMTRERADEVLNSGLVDLVGFGRPFISNPDLPHRLAESLPLADIRQDLVYSDGPEGYVDYPSLG